MKPKLLFSVLLFSFCVAVRVRLHGGKDWYIPRIIWSHWDDEDYLPEDVDEMIAVSRKSLENFAYCLVTSKNVSDFLETCSFPRIFNTLNVESKSDYIRMSLLEKYGGVYVDATTYVTSGEFMEWVFTEALNVKPGVFGFQKRNMVLIENCFIGAPQGSLFMKKFKEIYNTILNSDKAGVTAFLSESCTYLAWKTNFGDIAECGNPYFLMHHIFLMVYYNHSMGDDVLWWPWQRGQLALYIECVRDKDCFVDRLLHDTTARTMPLIKVTSQMRTGKRFHMDKSKEQKGNESSDKSPWKETGPEKGKAVEKTVCPLK